MAINSNLVIYPGAEMRALDMAMLMGSVTPSTKGIVWGCTSTKANDTTVHTTAGWVIVYGRLVRVDAGDITVPLSSSGTVTKYLQLEVDLANSSAPSSISVVTTPGTDSENFNVSDGRAYFTLATLTVSTAAVTAVSSSTSTIVPSTDVGNIYTLNQNGQTQITGDGATWTVIASGLLLPKGVYACYGQVSANTGRDLGMTVGIFGASSGIRRIDIRNTALIPYMYGLRITVNVSGIFEVTDDSTTMSLVACSSSPITVFVSSATFVKIK